MAAGGIWSSVDFKEIISRIVNKDEAVTRCFFFWDGPSLERIEEIRRTNPLRAASLPRPVCATARPVLIRTLCRIYGPGQFNYSEKVTELYQYLISAHVLEKISDPDKLMGFMATVAFNYWLGEKKRSERLLLENGLNQHLNVESHDTAEDISTKELKEYVKEVLAAMPNRSYASLLDEEVLDIMGMTGSEKAERTRAAAEKIGISVEHFYVKVSLAKKQFKATAIKMMQGRL